MASKVGRTIEGVAAAVIMAAPSPNREGYPEAATKRPLVIARVGFIGLGAMGEPMARSLRRAGFAVTACVHRRRDALERLRAEGVIEAEDPAALAGGAEAVVLCVPDAPQVEEALFGPRGVKPGARTWVARDRYVDDFAGCVAPVCRAPRQERGRVCGCAGKRRPASRRRRHANDHGRGVGRRVRTREAGARRDGVAASLGPGRHGRDRQTGQSDHYRKRDDRKRRRARLCKRGRRGPRRSLRGARVGDGLKLRSRKVAAENLAGRHVRGRLRAGSAAQGRRGCGTRRSSGCKTTDAGHWAGVPTLHQP